MSRPFRPLRLTCAALLAAALASQAAQAQQQQQAGVAAAVRGRVEVAMTTGAVGRELKSGEPVYLGNAIKSGPDSGLQILLLDQTTFTIGPDSELTIDQFVFDPATSTGKVAASVAKGVFRFVTGKVAQKDPASMSVRLPAGNIGIRGTIAIGSVEPAAGGQALRQEVVLIGPGRQAQGTGRAGALLLGGAGGGQVTIDQPGFGSTFQRDGTWGTPVRYTMEMMNAIQTRLGAPITGRGPGAAAQGSPPPGGAGMGGGPNGQNPAGPGGPAGPGTQGPPPQLVAGPQQDRPRDCAASGVSASNCGSLNASSAAAMMAMMPPPPPQIPDGPTSFDQLRAITTGNFYFGQTGVPLSGGGTYNFFLNVNPGARTVGGDFSRVDINGLNVSGTIFLGFQPFLANTGNAAFTYPGLPGLTGVLCSPSCTTNVNVTQLNNIGGVAAATANHGVFVNGGGPTTQGTGVAPAQPGQAP